MSFHQSAEDIRVDDGHILRARLNNGSEFVDAEIDLDQIIGNSNGVFEWGGVNFSHSAQDISFTLEGGENVPILRATLAQPDGEVRTHDINLAERIGNQGGQFAFQ